MARCAEMRSAIVIGRAVPATTVAVESAQAAATVRRRLPRALSIAVEKLSPSGVTNQDENAIASAAQQSGSTVAGARAGSTADDSVSSSSTGSDPMTVAASAAIIAG